MNNSLLRTRELLVRIGCLALFLVGVGNTALAAEGQPDNFGVYVGAGCPKGDLVCVPTTKSDVVRIDRTTDGRAKVSLRISYDRGHTCNFEGAGTWEGGSLKLVAEGLEPTQPCELKLIITGTALEIEDAEQRCRAVYCGSRGTLEGTRFRREKRN